MNKAIELTTTIQHHTIEINGRCFATPNTVQNYEVLAENSLVKTIHYRQISSVEAKFASVMFE